MIQEALGGGVVKNGGGGKKNHAYKWMKPNPPEGRECGLLKVLGGRANKVLILSRCETRRGRRTIEKGCIQYKKFLRSRREG